MTVAGSQFPPESTTQTRSPSDTGQAPDRSAANAAAPPGSTINRTSSHRARCASRIWSSVTRTMRSTRSRTIGNVWSPTLRRAERIGREPADGNDDGFARRERRRHRGASLRLDADHTHAIPAPGRDPGERPSPSHAHQDHVDIGHLLLDLDPERPLTGDHLGLVERDASPGRRSPPLAPPTLRSPRRSTPRRS